MGAKYTESQKDAIYNYRSNNAKIEFTVPKEKKERYQAQAKENNLSLSAYIIKTLDEK